MNTHLFFVIDSSGSMYPVKDEVISGFNTFLQEQRKFPDSRVTLISFNEQANIIINNRPILEVENLTSKSYTPENVTAFYDSLLLAVNMADQNSQFRCMIIVFTDGLDNASEAIDLKTLSSLIKESKHEFLFLGTYDMLNIAQELSISDKNMYTFTHTSASMTAAMRSVTASTSIAQTTGKSLSFVP